jgi:hypothetical protein
MKGGPSPRIRALASQDSLTFRIFAASGGVETSTDSRVLSDAGVFAAIALLLLFEHFSTTGASNRATSLRTSIIPVYISNFDAARNFRQKLEWSSVGLLGRDCRLVVRSIPRYLC